MSFARAIATVGSLTILSRISGFARDIITAALLGTGPMADAFLVALRLPNFLRRFFAEGTFGTAFIPMFSAKLETDGPEAARDFARQALSILLAALVPLTALAMVAMPSIVMLLAPGFVDEPEKFALSVQYSRITFPYLLMVSVVAFFGGILNAVDKFGPFAAAPIMFNMTLIAALLISHLVGGTAALFLSWGVVAAGIVQIIWLGVAVVRSGWVITLVRPRLTAPIKRLFMVMAPSAIGAGVLQINIMIDMMLASLLPGGAMSYLYYADRLNQLPLSVIGIAIGTALLPTLSRHMAAARRDQASYYFCRGLEFGLILGIPAALGLGLLAEPIMSTLFERGAFTATDARATAWALMGYAFGIPGYVVSKVLNAAFFAQENTKSPVTYAIIGTISNTLISLSLIPLIGHVGIAVATGIAAWVQVGLLARGLRKNGAVSLDADFRRRIRGVFYASTALLIVLLGCKFGMDALLQGRSFHALPELIRFGGLIALIAPAACCYVGVIFLTRTITLADVKGWMRRDRTQPAAPTAPQGDPS